MLCQLQHRSPPWIRTSSTKNVSWIAAACRQSRWRRLRSSDLKDLTSMVLARGQWRGLIRFWLHWLLLWLEMTRGLARFWHSNEGIKDYGVGGKMRLSWDGWCRLKTSILIFSFSLIFFSLVPFFFWFFPIFFSFSFLFLFLLCFSSSFFPVFFSLRFFCSFFFFQKLTIEKKNGDGRWRRGKICGKRLEVWALILNLM